MRNQILTKILVIMTFCIILVSKIINAETLPIKSGQVWTGTYQCGQGQGLTSLQLNIDDVSTKSTTSSEGIKVYPVTAKYIFKSRFGSGSFVIRGAFSPKDMILNFVPHKWIQRPPRFGMAGLKGKVSASGREYLGQIDFNGCGKFQVSLNDDAYRNGNVAHNTVSKNPQHNPYVASINQPFFNRVKKQAQVKPKKINSKAPVRTDGTARKELEPIRNRYRQAYSVRDLASAQKAIDEMNVVAEKYNDKMSLRHIASDKSRLDLITPASNVNLVDLQNTFEESKYASRLNKSLSVLEILPVRYNFESRRLPKKVYKQQVIARKLADIYPFPLDKNPSIPKFKERHRELTQLWATAKSRALPFAQSTTYSSLTKVEQARLVKQELYPLVTKIQVKTIEMLAAIPFTIEGIKLARDVNHWLDINEYDYLSDWIYKVKIDDSRGGGRWDPTDYNKGQEAFFEESTGKFYPDISYEAALLRDVWRVQYARSADRLIAQNIKRDGVDMHADALSLSFKLASQDVRNGILAKIDFSDEESNQFCIYDDCSSLMVATFKQENTGDILLPEQSTKIINLISKNIHDLNKEWKNSKSSNISAQNITRSKMAKYSTGSVTASIQKLVSTTVNDLSQINVGDQKKYNDWNINTLSPLVSLISELEKIYEIGFSVTAEDRAVRAFFLPIDDYTSVGLNALDEARYPRFMAEIVAEQYAWHKESEIGSRADPSVDIPLGWSSGKSKIKIEKPKRYTARLMTPTEILFDQIGVSAGKTASAFISYAGKLVEFRQKISKSRAEYFACYPKCENIERKTLEYSKVLAEKDLYYYQLSGQSQSLLYEGVRRQSIVVEGASGANGFTLIDNGIPFLCSGLFDSWVVKAGKSYDNSGERMDKALDGLLKALYGDLSSAQKISKDIEKNHQSAFIAAAEEYGQYQTCRDQIEFSLR